jgi:hypothetical protein
MARRVGFASPLDIRSHHRTAPRTVTPTRKEGATAGTPYGPAGRSRRQRRRSAASSPPETTRWQHAWRSDDLSPDGYSLDNFYPARGGVDDIQLTSSATTRVTSRLTDLQLLLTHAALLAGKERSPSSRAGEAFRSRHPRDNPVLRHGPLRSRPTRRRSERFATFSR